MTSLSAMKAFIGMFGLTKNQVETYILIFAIEERNITIEVPKQQEEAVFPIESTSKTAQPLWRRSADEEAGRAILLLELNNKGLF
jgi:hypothetical protein